MERLEAFRGLIRHGNLLLGEVVTYCREAEQAVAQFAAEKESADVLKSQLIEANAVAAAANAEARHAEAALEGERMAVQGLRAELAEVRRQLDELQQHQSQREADLARTLAESTERHTRLMQEAAASQVALRESKQLDARLARAEGVEARLRSMERELLETRQALEQERGRRDRAIALIRPKLAEEVRA